MISRRNKNKGFTLIELLVVIAIMGLLSSVVLTSVESARAKGRDGRRLQDLTAIRTAIELYRTSVGSYPTTGGSWWGLCPTYNVSGTKTNTGASGYIPNLAPTYISVLPADPKPIPPSYCYLYNSNGTDYMFLVYGSVEAGTITSLLRPIELWNQSFAIYSDGARGW